MRILHVSNFGDKHNGRLYWNQCFKISNGFIRNGHNVYNFSDRDRSRSTIFNKFSDNEFVQKELLQTIENYRPNLLVLGHADRITNKTLRQIREKEDIKIIEWNVDNLYLDNSLNKLLNRSHQEMYVQATYVIKKLLKNADNLNKMKEKNKKITWSGKIKKKK